MGYHVFVAILHFTLVLLYCQCKIQHVASRHLESVDCCRQILQIPPALENIATNFLPLLLPLSLIACIMQSKFSWEFCWWCLKQNRIYFAQIQVKDIQLEHYKNIDLSVNMRYSGTQTELFKALYLHSWISKHSHPL